MEEGGDRLGRCRTERPRLRDPIVTARAGHHRCRPQRVLHTIGQLTHGGAELQLLGLLRHGTGDAFQHAVVCFWRAADEGILAGLKEARCPVFFLDKRRGVDLGFVFRLASLIRSWRPDVVHTWLQSGGLWGRIAARLGSNPPVVSSFRGEEAHRWPGGKYLDRLLAAHTAECVVNSRRLQTVLAERLNRDESEIRLIPNGLEVSRFRREPPDAGVRRRLGLPEAGCVVTMVATMRPVKNWPLFLEVAGRVTAQRPDVTFVAAGGGPLLEEMKGRAASAGLGPDRVRMLGKRNDVPDILAQSDLFVLTSDFEGMPNAILEAMASRLCVVATRCSGTEEVVVDGETGFLADVGDADGLVRHVLHCVDNPNQAEALGAEARRRAVRDFSFEKMADGHRRAYCRALSSRRASGAAVPSPTGDSR